MVATIAPRCQSCRHPIPSMTIEGEEVCHSCWNLYMSLATLRLKQVLGIPTS